MDRGDNTRAAFAVAVVVLLLALAECVALYRPQSWVYRDVRFYLNQNVTLVENLGLEQSQFASSWYNGRLGWNRELPASFSNIALGRHGEHWPMHPYVMPLLATPLFWAFDLFGALAFSLLCATVVAFCGYRFARAYVGPAPAAVATVAFLYATGQRDYFYYYSIDSLLCASFAALLYAVVTGRAWLAGLMLGLSVVIKPTTMMHGPALLLLAIEHRRSLGFAGRGLLASTGVVGAWAAGNTYQFGAPWSAPYTRVLVVHGGVPQIESDVHAFGTPLRQGLKRVLTGDFGLAQHFTVFALAAPGLLMLYLRRPLYALAATLSAAASLVVFSKFQYEGFRFHFPTFALLLPALAASAQLAVELAQALARRARAWMRLEAGVAALTLALMAAGGVYGWSGPTERQVGDGPWVTGAMALGSRGTLDLRAAELGPPPADPLASPYTRSRFGQWLPRASPAAVVLAAPAAALGGKIGLALLVILAAGIAAFAAARLAARVGGEATAAACGLALVVLPRDGLQVSGPAWLATAAALVALDLALAERWATAGALAVLAAWLADAPWLAAPVGALLAVAAGRRALLRFAVGAAAPLVLWGVGHLVLIGRPFASPDDFVLVARAGGEATVAVGHRTLARALAAHVGEPGPLRGLLFVLAPAATLGVLAALGRGRPRVALALLALPATVFLPGTGPLRGLELPALPPLVVAALLPAAAVFAGEAGRALARLAGRLGGRRGLVAALAALLALGLVGGVRRGLAAREPWRFESVRAVREATVSLGTTPCDFLGWEHMSWECSHLDVGAMGMVGLATQESIRVGGHEVRALVVPTGTSGMVRHVRWETLPRGRALELSWAVPDGHRGGAEVEVRLDGREATRFETPREPTGRFRRIRLPVPPAGGGPLRLEISARARGRQAVTVLVGGPSGGVP